jgi:hypothetical protein
MDDGDTRRQRLLGSAKRNLAAEDDDPARVGGINPRDDPAERALPGAVLSAERMARPHGDVEGDVFERQHAGEALGHRLQADCGIAHRTITGVQTRWRVLSANSPTGCSRQKRLYVSGAPRPAGRPVCGHPRQGLHNKILNPWLIALADPASRIPDPESPRRSGRQGILR